MRISSFNINKFCGPYSNKNGGYYNPRNIDFKSDIKNLVKSLLKEKEDIFFLQEFIDNVYIDIKTLFPENKYIIHSNKLNSKSNVVAITLKESKWEKSSLDNDNDYSNKHLSMQLKTKNLKVICFHNTAKKINDIINKCFEQNIYDIILGDFNNECTTNINYRDLITKDMITLKSSQQTVDHIFIKKEKDLNEFKNKLVFNGVIETYTSDHNLLTFQLNI